MPLFQINLLNQVPIILFYAFKPIFNVVVIELKFCLWIMQTRQGLSKSMNDKK